MIFIWGINIVAKKSTVKWPQTCVNASGSNSVRGNAANSREKENGSSYGILHSLFPIQSFPTPRHLEIPCMQKKQMAIGHYIKNINFNE